MEKNSTQNGWNEWSKYVLKELERLDSKQGSLDQNFRNEIDKMKNLINIIDENKKNISNLEDWKAEMDDIASITQLKDMKVELEKLKIFRSQAIIIVPIIQIILAIIVAFITIKSKY